MQPYLEYVEHVLVTEETHANLVATGHDRVGKRLLREKPLISSTGEQRVALERYLGEDDVCIMIESMSSRVKFVREMDGCALVPPFVKWMHRYDTEGLSIVPLKDPYKVELAFVGDPEVLDSRFCFELRAKLNEHYRTFERHGLCKLM